MMSICVARLYSMDRGRGIEEQCFRRSRLLIGRMGEGRSKQSYYAYTSIDITEEMVCDYMEEREILQRVGV